jgi:inner membrane protein
METQTKNPPEKSSGGGERLALKSIIITVLVLVLWGAVMLVQSIIDERQWRQQEAIQEVSSKWGKRQTVSGPVLTIPYIEYEKNPNAYNEPGKQLLKVTKYAHFLPEKLKVNGRLFPEKLYRGIYDVIVYNSNLNLKGKFSPPDFSRLDIPKENILFDDAFVSVGISDMRGIKNNVALAWNGENKPMNPGIASKDVLEGGVSVPVIIGKADSEKLSYDFSFNLELKGVGAFIFYSAWKRNRG